MCTNEITIREKIGSGTSILNAAIRTEDRMQLLNRTIKDILDEIGDCIHDDTTFRRGLLSEIFLRPDVKKRIASKFISIIIQE